MINLSRLPLATGQYQWCSTFADNLFDGNQTLILRLNHWPSVARLQHISRFVGMHEMTFIVVSQDKLEMRWFLNGTEVPLCGHAALAVSHLIKDAIALESPVPVANKNGRLSLINSSDKAAILLNPQPLKKLDKTFDFGLDYLEVYDAGRDYFFVVDSLATLERFAPDERVLAQIDKIAFCISAPHPQHTAALRFFVPPKNLFEDSASASAIPALAQYWAKDNTTDMSFLQCTDKKLVLEGQLTGMGVKVKGQVKTFAKGTLAIEI